MTSTSGRIKPPPGYGTAVDPDGFLVGAENDDGILISDNRYDTENEAASAGWNHYHAHPALKALRSVIVDAELPGECTYCGGDTVGDDEGPGPHHEFDCLVDELRAVLNPGIKNERHH